MEKSKILLIDMYGVIIKESKGYFVPYTLQRFGASEQGRIKRIIKDEQCFTKTQKGELTSAEFLSYPSYQLGALPLHPTKALRGLLDYRRTQSTKGAEKYA